MSLLSLEIQNLEWQGDARTKVLCFQILVIETVNELPDIDAGTPNIAAVAIIAKLELHRPRKPYVRCSISFLLTAGFNYLVVQVGRSRRTAKCYSLLSHEFVGRKMTLLNDSDIIFSTLVLFRNNEAAVDCSKDIGTYVYGSTPVRMHTPEKATCVESIKPSNYVLLCVRTIVFIVIAVMLCKGFNDQEPLTDVDAEEEGKDHKAWMYKIRDMRGIKGNIARYKDMMRSKVTLAVNRVSWSLRPKWADGSWCKLGARRTMDEGEMLSSPFLATARVHL
ncbi:hypothetical protein DFJ58DRAFT_848739 [Suillus subalutaceus]|uniref:uncharacterized protein n=1 Tax=Suillus subalutaceus TaxID=48586 RepID=UPI001B881BE7|nr:uncharacterized protein DFJ58DRAFT_848739 [Suillus subalutaceus]KAG1829390.1 hypothetical protein DFJ58DRAFT_848739 [Suillus subalutaceus]